MASSNGSGGVPVPYATKKAVYASTAKVATNGTVSNASRTDYDDAMAAVKARGAGHRDDQMLVVDGVTVDAGEVIRSYLNDHYTEKGLPLILRLAKAIFVPDPGQCFGSNRSWTGCGLETVSLIGTFFPPLKAAKAGKIADAAHDVDKAVDAEKAANDVDDLVRTCLRSFAGSTVVLLADGSKKPISQISVGDRVVATDPVTGARFIRRVTHLWVHDDELADLVLGDGTVITTTEDHLFWSVTDERFEQADQLATNEVVLGDEGRRITVVGFRDGTSRIEAAYNLSIEGVHTYHVGVDEILVHNDNDSPVGTVFRDGNYRFQIYSNDHGPAHGHLTGPGIRGGGIQIGQNGKPLDPDVTLNSSQRGVIDRNLSAIRKSIGDYMKWHRQNGPC